ncbi:transmembrane protein 267 [Prorops nasuta]|uniref:transmembrane protein 267 n=1 Tax=Prorops nasuta TaxID=863751 RepID=UPI0034CF27BC
MPRSKLEYIVQLLLTLSIGIVSILGDRGLKFGKTEILRAIYDNLTHGTVGALTWALILALLKKLTVSNLQSVIICFFISSFVDIDHFIESGTWRINDATHLNRRPFLHCTTVPIVIWALLLIFSRAYHKIRLYFSAWMILTSFLSHHIRDANRRGWWFCPIGSTKPLPYFLYISLDMALPYIAYYIMSWHTPPIIEKHSMPDIV